MDIYFESRLYITVKIILHVINGGTFFVLYRAFFTLELQDDYSTKNFSHLALQNLVCNSRVYLQPVKTLRVQEKCFTIIRVHFRRALWVRANER